MANIIKASSGLLFSEDFGADTSLLWTVSPNFPDRVVQNSGSISLLPGTERMELLIPTPDGSSYVLQSDTDYNPTVAADTGGVTLRSLTDSTVDFEVIGDNTKVFKYSKCTIDNYNVLSAIGSTDGLIWQEYGNTKVTNMNKVGYFMGAGTTTDSLDINDCKIYKNNYIIFNNFNRTNLIKLFDATGVEITNNFILKKRNTQVQLDGTEIIYPITTLIVRVYDRDTLALLHEGTINNVYGGDIYEYDYNVSFYINGVLLTDTLYDLGLISASQEFELRVVNNEAYALSSRKLSISYYTYTNPGYQSVDIAEANSTDFKKELNVSFTAGEAKTFKLKVSDYKTYLNLDDSYRFKINLE